MKAIKYFACFLFLALSSRICSQDQSIYIFDPNVVSSSFQYTLSQLTEDSVFVADSLDDSIYYYDAAFLFIDFPYVLSEINVDRVKNYTAEGKPTYLVSDPAIDSTNLAFWNHIGLNEMLYLLVSSLVDSVTGIDTTFTQGIVIDTSFMSWGIPSPIGTISPILTGQSSGLDIHPTYISTIDTLIVILDLYNLINDEGFLRRVLEKFELIPPNDVKDEFSLVADFKLFQNYPNPFNPSTKIKFTIPPATLRQTQSDNWVTLKVYDVLGNEIAILLNEEKQPGAYEVEFNSLSGISDLPAGRQGLVSGIYFYQLKEGNYAQTRKMILLK